MANRRRGLIPPARWTDEELDADRQQAIDSFRRERLDEPIEDYGKFFDHSRATVEALLLMTNDLSHINEAGVDILTDSNLLGAFRYLAGPPFSEDDLKTLTDTPSLSKKSLQERPEIVHRLVATVRDALDRRRFSWIIEGRQPRSGEREAAILATASLAAAQRVATKRRNEGKTNQEAAVRDALRSLDFTQISLPNAEVRTLAEAPKPGEFTTEVSLAGRKADLLVGLWDHRLMPIECKVSNSSVNSIKRLNNDAAAKAEGWMTDLGRIQIVPVAVLSGVYSLSSLQRSQNRGLTLYWAHRLSDLTGWIERTRQER